MERLSLRLGLPRKSLAARLVDLRIGKKRKIDWVDLAASVFQLHIGITSFHTSPDEVLILRPETISRRKLPVNFNPDDLSLFSHELERMISQTAQTP
jgi:hypothetical protein